MVQYLHFRILKISHWTSVTRWGQMGHLILRNLLSISFKFMPVEFLGWPRGGPLGPVVEVVTPLVEKNGVLMVIQWDFMVF